MPLLEVENLCVELIAERRRLIDGLNFQIKEGETFCLIGESGSGKSLTALAITRLLNPMIFHMSGRICLDGLEVLSSSVGDLRGIRGAKASYIFQNPAAHLNPVMRIGNQILEMLSLHQASRANRERVIELLKMVGIPAPEIRAKDYPHQMSGGMLQRVMIAMALASEPQLLIADEPTTALDVTIQAQILELLSKLQQRLTMAVLLVSHNLGVVKEFGDRLAVMYAGQIVEIGEACQVLSEPRHPYTLALIEAIPQLGKRRTKLPAIPGSAAMAGTFPKGCRFHPRCDFAIASCKKASPDWIKISNRHSARCPIFNPS